MEKPHIKQNYMGSGVPFHPNFIPTIGHKNTLPIPLVDKYHASSGQLWFFYKNVKNTFKWMPMVFLPRSIKRPLKIMISGLVVVDIKDGWVEMDVIHSKRFEWNCGSGIGCNLL